MSARWWIFAFVVWMLAQTVITTTIDLHFAEKCQQQLNALYMTPGQPSG